MNKQKATSSITAIKPPGIWREPTVYSMANETKLEDLDDVFNELDLALMPLLTLRDEICEEDFGDRVNGVLGLYIRHVERVLERGQWLARHKELLAVGK
jgi:hypothetical protein